MAFNPAASPQSSDGRMIRFANGNPVFPSGAFYILYGATGSIAPSTETSVFTNDTSTSTPLVVGPGNAPYNFPGSTRYMAGAVGPTGTGLPLGTMFNFDLYGLATFASTPNLTIRMGFNSGTTFGTFNVLATTGAVATTNTSGGYAHIQGGFSVTKTGTSGQITGYVGIEYAATGIMIISPVTQTTIDTTQPYQLDVLATISTGASTLQMFYGAIEVIG